MSVNGFFEGLDAGVTTGVKLGNAFALGNDRRGTQEAGEILAEMTAMNAPGIGQQPGAIPSEGEETTEAPVGHDGMPWNDRKGAYMKALNRVTDMKTRLALEEQLTRLEKGKILEYGNNALAALDQGDLDGAQRYFAGLSYFTDPGSTPTSIVTPDGKFVVQDEDGTTQGFDRQGLIDMMHRAENFEGWAGLTFDRQRHADDMAFRNKQLAEDVAYNAGRLAIHQQTADSGQQYDEAGIEYRKKQAEKLQHDMDIADKGALANATAAQLEKLQADSKEMSEHFDSLFADPKNTGKKQGGSAEDEAIMALDPDDMTELERERYEAIKRSEGAIDLASASSDTNTADARQRQAALRQEMVKDPTKRVIANAVMQGIRLGNPEKSLTNREIADIAFAATLDRDGHAGISKDGSSVYVGGQRYELAEHKAQQLRGLLGAEAEEPAPTPAPNETGIPTPPG